MTNKIYVLKHRLGLGSHIEEESSRFSHGQGFHAGKHSRCCLKFADVEICVHSLSPMKTNMSVTSFYIILQGKKKPVKMMMPFVVANACGFAWG